MKKKIAIIGGGAAGMMAAIQAARAGALVTLYERNEKVGKKILATGNGKCNFSNEQMNCSAYYGSGVSLLPSLLTQFGVAQTKSFFEELGMRIKNRNGSRRTARRPSRRRRRRARRRCRRKRRW